MTDCIRSFACFFFRYRIFVSLTIVLFACLWSYGWGRETTIVSETLFSGRENDIAFLIALALCGVASWLRMSAGTALHSGRVMSFEIRSERLILSPPYNLVRNPVYLADLMAACGFALCMPAQGLVYPVGLFIHYTLLIRYEETALARSHGDRFSAFWSDVPRLVPTAKSLSRYLRSLRRGSIDYDGFRYNSLYILFIPGFVIAAFTGQFLHAVVVGLPGVADWGYWHTVKGLSKPRAEEL